MWEEFGKHRLGVGGKMGREEQNGEGDKEKEKQGRRQRSRDE